MINLIFIALISKLATLLFTANGLVNTPSQLGQTHQLDQTHQLG